MKAETEIYLDILHDLKNNHLKQILEYNEGFVFEIPEKEEDIEKLFYCGELEGWTSECLQEFRSSYFCETDLETEWSRHYESKSVAKQLYNDKWVGYTYWFGGGKHGQPDKMPWIEHAYFLNCEKRIVEKNFFSKA